MSLSDADKSRVLEELENSRLEASRKVTFYAGYGRAQWYKADEAELAGLIERVKEAFGEGGGE